MRKIAYLCGALCIVVAGIFAYPRIKNYYYKYKFDQAVAQTMQEITSKDVIEKQLVDSVQKSAIKPVLPEKAYLEVPYFCQAPFTNKASWDFHGESCEEAAILQAVYYFRGIKVPDLTDVDKTLRDMVAWQEKHYGVHKDIHADTIKMFMTSYFNYKPHEIEIIRNASVFDIKQSIAAGFPVVAPIKGEVLKNPYYHHPGYHMLTVIGYTRDRLITNDVGTKRGKNFSYELERFKLAMDAEGGDIVILKPDTRK